MGEDKLWHLLNVAFWISLTLNELISRYFENGITAIVISGILNVWKEYKFFFIWNIYVYYNEDSDGSF